jgi:hypothetical protein
VGAADKTEGGGGGVLRGEGKRITAEEAIFQLACVVVLGIHNADPEECGLHA